MAAHGSPGEYKDVLLFLATAGVAVPLFQRLKISPVLGFLVAGALLGPYGLGALADQVPALALFTISDPDQIRVLGELGVVFLLFTIGLELSWERLRRLRKLVFGLGFLQIAACASAIGGVALALGVPVAGAVALGAGLALSSTAIVAPVLVARDRLKAPSGRATFATLLAQDLAVAPLLFAVAFVASKSDGNPLVRLGLTLLPAVIGMALLIVGGRLLLRPMMRSVARGKSQELFFAACLLVVIASGVAAQLAGLSMALGAFVAGVLLAETEFRKQVEVAVEPFKGLLLGLFFVSVGIGLNVGQLIERPVLVAALTLGSIAVKVALTFALARLFGLKTRPALETALAIGPAGEFAFVILGQDIGGGVDPALIQAALVSATLSIFAAPFLLRLGEKLAAEPAAKTDPAQPETPPPAVAPRVIVAGYGRVGKLVGGMLGRHDVDWLALDTDVDAVAAARKADAPVWFGDAARADFLNACGLAEARALVITMDAPAQVEEVARMARQLRPDLIVIARARDARHAARLYELGVTDAVPETIESSLQLAENTLVDIGVPMGLVIASIHQRREEYRNLFRDKIEGDREPRALGGAGTARRRLAARRDRAERKDAALTDPAQ